MQDVPAAEISRDGQDLVRRIGRPLAEAGTWMQLSGLVMILLGVASILTIWGILFCWIPIWLGVLLIKSATGFETARNSGEEATLLQSMSRLKTVFIILGLMMALELLLIVIGLIVAGGVMMAGLGEL